VNHDATDLSSPKQKDTVWDEDFDYSWSSVRDLFWNNFFYLFLKQKGPGLQSDLITE
jgi:hypothetical protein